MSNRAHFMVFYKKGLDAGMVIKTAEILTSKSIPIRSVSCIALGQPHQVLEDSVGDVPRSQAIQSFARWWQEQPERLVSIGHRYKEWVEAASPVPEAFSIGLWESKTGIVLGHKIHSSYYQKLDFCNSSYEDEQEYGKLPPRTELPRIFNGIMDLGMGIYDALGGARGWYDYSDLPPLNFPPRSIHLLDWFPPSLVAHSGGPARFTELPFHSVQVLSNGGVLSRPIENLAERALDIHLEERGIQLSKLHDALNLPRDPIETLEVDQGWPKRRSGWFGKAR